jgi:hypothetical protein
MTTETKGAAAAAHKTGSELYAEFAERVARLQQEGLVDLKMKVFVNPAETTSAGIIKTLNNALRLREVRKAKRRLTAA